MSTEIEYHNLDTLPQYDALQRYAAQPRSPMDHERIMHCDLPFVDGVRYNYAARLLSRQELKTLCELGRRAQLIAKYRALAGGACMNPSEGRMVLYHLLRGRLTDSATPIVDSDGNDIARFYEQEKRKVYDCANKVRSGAIRPTGGTVARAGSDTAAGNSNSAAGSNAADNSPATHFEAVVQIGIGGSDLGPRALYEALKGWAVQEGISPLIPAYFISNVDPDDGLSVLSRIPPRSTLFILVSKSGSTIETLTNANLVSEFLKAHGVREPKRHIVVVTAKGSPLAQDTDYAAHFFIDDHINGRYSCSGAVGGVVLSVAFGSDVFDAFLRGAHQADKSAQHSDPLRNPPLLDALCGMYERHIFGLPRLRRASVLTGASPLSGPHSAVGYGEQRQDGQPRRSAHTLYQRPDCLWRAGHQRPAQLLPTAPSGLHHRAVYFYRL